MPKALQTRPRKCGVVTHQRVESTPDEHTFGIVSTYSVHGQITGAQVKQRFEACPLDTPQAEIEPLLRTSTASHVWVCSNDVSIGCELSAIALFKPNLTLPLHVVLEGVAGHIAGILYSALHQVAATLDIGHVKRACATASNATLK